MATPVPQTGQQLYNLLVETYAANANIPADTSEGSTLWAIFQACKLLGLQQQQQTLGPNGTANLARLATSFGADVDSFTVPFGVIRLGAIAASGNVTFGINSQSGTQIVVPIGYTVSTSTGLQYTVIVDPTNSAYSQSAGGYIITPGSLTVSALVQCVFPGSFSNAQAGQIDILVGGTTTGPIPALSSVTNPAAFTNGADSETDAQLKTRFTLQVSSGVVSTTNAIAAAVLSVEPNLTYSIADLTRYTDLSSQNGYMTIVVNQLGSGASASSTLIQAAQAAVNNVRSGGVNATVIGPTMIPISVTGHIVLAPNAASGLTVSAADAAVATYLNSIALDPAGAQTSVSPAKVASIVLGVPGVADVNGVTLNGSSGTTIIAPLAHQLSAGTIAFTNP